MKVNDVIKTKSGKHFTVQRAEKMGPNNIEYLLLYEIETGDLAIGYVEDETLQFVNDQKQIMAIAKQFDKIKSENADK